VEGSPPTDTPSQRYPLQWHNRLMRLLMDGMHHRREERDVSELHPIVIPSQPWYYSPPANSSPRSTNPQPAFLPFPLSFFPLKLLPAPSHLKFQTHSEKSYPVTCPPRSHQTLFQCSHKGKSFHRRKHSLGRRLVTVSSSTSASPDLEEPSLPLSLHSRDTVGVYSTIDSGGNSSSRLAAGGQ